MQRAEKLFQKMTEMYEAGQKDARPNEYSYVFLINAIVRSNEENNAQRAEDVLFQMYKQFKDGNPDVKPKTKLISAVIDCWANSGKSYAGEKAEALLDWMVKIYEEGGDTDFRPNEYTFSSSKCSTKEQIICFSIDVRCGIANHF